MIIYRGTDERREEWGIWHDALANVLRVSHYMVTTPGRLDGVRCVERALWGENTIDAPLPDDVAAEAVATLVKMAQQVRVER